MNLVTFAAKIADVLDTVTLTDSRTGEELTDYAKCYIALTGHVEGVSGNEVIALFDGKTEAPVRTKRLLEEVWASAGDDRRELERQLWEAAARDEWPVGLDRTPRTVTTNRTCVVVDDRGVTVTTRDYDRSEALDWNVYCDEAFEALGGVDLVESSVLLLGNLSVARDGENHEEFFPWAD